MGLRIRGRQGHYVPRNSFKGEVLMVRLFYYPPIDVLLHFPLAHFVSLLYIFTFAM
jgi:hypothetical protein